MNTTTGSTLNRASALEEVVEELESTKATHANRTSTEYEILGEVVGDLFNGRVGLPYSDAQLEAIRKEGEERYARKVLPGYKDDGKDEATSSGPTNYRKYGDLARLATDHRPCY